MLVDDTGRLFRDNEAAISSQIAASLERLGNTAERERPGSKRGGRARSARPLNGRHARHKP
jgi:hypothetical protein